MSGLCGLYRYCPLHMVDAAARLGWHILGPCPGHWAEYSWLVVWLCDCEVRKIGRPQSHDFINKNARFGDAQ